MAADALTELDSVLATAEDVDPWNDDGSDQRFVPDLATLSRLLRIPIAAGNQSQSGRFAKAIDAWAAQELRRAGFDPDAVWPRRERPRVLAHDLVRLLDKLPPDSAEDLREKITKLPSVAPADVRILGRAYEKQVDVAISRWDTGPQLLLSTKAQVASFGKNLSNRFEEAYGDAGNLRARYPLAGVGFLFVQRSTIMQEEPAAFERTIDMMRKLRDRGDGNGYTATGLILVGWDGNPNSNGDEGGSGVGTVEVLQDAVPEDLHPGQMFASLVRSVLDATPVTMHVRARERMMGRLLDVTPQDGPA